MSDIDDFLASEYEKSRPGLDLLSVEDAAVPFSWVTVDVLAQERKPFPLLEEFSLRALEAGIFNEGDIGLLLGLEHDIISETIVSLMQRDYVTRRPTPDGNWRLGLTALGVGAARDLSSVTPVSTHLGIAFDRLRWGTAAFKRTDLISHTEAKRRGLHILPGRQIEVTEADLQPQALNRLLSEADEDSQVEILAVRSIKPKARLLLPVKLLVFADHVGQEVQVGVVIDGELSRKHELELARLGGAEVLGIHAAPPATAPLEGLPPEAISARVAVDQVQELRAVVGEATAERIEVRGSGLPTAQPVQAAALLAAMDVRAVSVHEHRGLLLDALQNARSRLLIVSPWVKRAVVDTTFLSMLETRLRRKVKVTIAHGYGADDRGSDDSALKALSNLQQRFAENLDVVRLVNTHAKILVWDSTWVLTSFNWLSFKGDPARTYRMEEGTLVSVPELVDEAYERYLQVIEEDRL